MYVRQQLSLFSRYLYALRSHGVNIWMRPVLLVLEYQFKLFVDASNKETANQLAPWQPNYLLVQYLG